MNRYIPKQSIEQMFNPFTYKSACVIVTSDDSLDADNFLYLNLETQKDEVKKLIKAVFDSKMLSARQDHRDDILSGIQKQRADAKLQAKEKIIKEMLYTAFKNLFNEIPYGLH